jgi:hypothetical protein
MKTNADQLNAPRDHAEPDIDAGATPEELAAAVALRDADNSRPVASDDLAQLVQAVRAAASDGVLDDLMHNALLEHALEAADGDEPPLTSTDADAWQRALRAAHMDHELRASALDAILASTLGPPVAASPSPAVPAVTSGTATPMAAAQGANNDRAANNDQAPNNDTTSARAHQPRGLARVLTFARPHRIALTVAAIAAAACLGVWQRGASQSTATDSLALISVHSTAALFDAPFETQSTSARIDRMAAARRGELRENRFRAWGLK